MIKTYLIEFIEYDQDEGQKLTVQTKDIEYTVEQISRNRNIEKITYNEINKRIYDEDIPHSQGSIGI
tara:strand:- start:2231 stop:2431 length:201 start_codon:yes stop_codon:yes gene_type:complete